MRDSTQKFPTWALWIMGLLTLLAAALLILSIVLGVQAGQRQVELQSRQEVAIALVDAIDAQARGDYDTALDAYKHVLQLEPDNDAAREGIQQVLALVSSRPATAPPVAAAAEPPPSPTPTSDAATAPAATPTHTPGALASSSEALMQAATTAYNAGRWSETISRLTAIKQADQTYQPDRVNTLLFDAYVNLAGEKDNEGNLEEALSFFDRALQLDPNNTAVRAERDLIAKYLDALTYFGADWMRAVQALRDIHREEPAYRDVTDRLQRALVAYGDLLMSRRDACIAVEQYKAAARLTVTPGLIDKQNSAQTLCDEGEPVADVAGAATPGAPLAASTSAAETTTAPAPPVADASAPVATALRGRILYSARDITTGRNFVAEQLLGGSASPVVLQEEATQPALRPDGQRLLFRNVRNDMAGLGAIDPGTGLLLRFTQYAEDGFPSWSPQGNRVVFASNREGDRLWRVYVAWAETDGETANLGFGDTPAWHPASDLIVHRGCDASGNNCGLWLMNSSGGDRVPLTTVQADTRPSWAPSGRHVVFMSNTRDANMDIYRVDVTNGQVLRLTDHGALDGLPAVSPDGRWVAFVSNRDGTWKVWAVSINGGTATPLFAINGDLGNWLDQGIQWVN
ncbi:MAG: PD40 domain-containing protein [Caldilineaceae bacterium]|nr:PD40 domain-containing protein [Caldilineaceae bacterium]